jgi:hypothetical protein
MKKIKIDIDVASDEVKFATDEVLTLTQKVKLLKKELQTIPEGTKEWQTVNKAFNDNKGKLSTQIPVDVFKVLEKELGHFEIVF